MCIEWHKKVTSPAGDVCCARAWPAALASPQNSCVHLTYAVMSVAAVDAVALFNRLKLGLKEDGIIVVRGAGVKNGGGGAAW